MRYTGGGGGGGGAPDNPFHPTCVKFASGQLNESALA